MDIAVWLRDLGLEQYAGAFRANNVDAAVLPSLTAEDLKDLGVTSIGHRRRLFDAIAVLRDGRPPTGGGAPPAVAEPEPGTLPLPPAPSREPAAERRQLTVLFCDLVGSTALSARLDPEDLREVISDYHRRVAGVVERFEGHVANYMGDGVLAYFGYPRAHEDAAERAVRAGLELVEAVGRLKPHGEMALQVRVGIATGLVVVGDLLGEGAARGEVVGETPNLAARLQTLAAPDAVVIGPSTRRLVGGLFECADLGVHHLKGFARPVPAWRVLGPSGAENRFEARQQAAAGMTPLVGRGRELALLLERWQRAGAGGEGQVVLLVGEPGIGKSRLLQALRERLADTPHTRLSHYCSPYHQTSPLHPVIGHLERAAGFARDDDAAAKLAKLEALLRLAGNDLAEAAPLLAALLSLPTGGRYPPLNLTPQRQKARTLEVLVTQLAGLASRQPVLLVLEDAHWLDPTTRELFDLTIERVRDLPVLVVITYRPEFQPPWVGHAHVTALTLARLSRRQGMRVVERVTDKALPAEVVEQIAAKADGVPLFVEELTKAVLESGLLREEGDRYVPTGPLPPLAIPSTLQDSLMARLDRLAPVKEVAQIGAALGREFSYELLAAVAPLRNNELKDALDQVCSSELVLCRGTPPVASYSFKHVLIRDAAYETLLKSKRQQLHALIVRVLEDRFPEQAEAQPEVLAHHCTYAGLAGRAADYWHRAGQRAIERSAMAEAVTQLTRGLEVLQGLPDGHERDRRELGLQIALGVALIPLKGQAAPETGRAYARARELCREVGEAGQLVSVLYGQWIFHNTRAECCAARDVAEELVQLGRQQHDAAAQIIGWRTLGLTSLVTGEFGSALKQLERVHNLANHVQHRSLAFSFSQDPWPTARAWMAWALLALGYPDQALGRHQEGLARAHELGHANTLAQVLFCGCILRQLLRDHQRVAQLVGVLIPLSMEQGFPYWSAMAKIVQGWALAQAGELKRAADQITQGLDAYRATGAELWVPYFLRLLAEVEGRAEQPAEGLRLMDEALVRLERTGERWCEAELHRYRGELLLALRKADQVEAEVCFRRASEVARAQDAKLWELRAAVSLTRLWRNQGRRKEARELLAPVYGWFTEGFDSPDLKDAAALLGGLR